MLSVRPKFSYFVLDTCRMIQTKAKGTVKKQMKPHRKSSKETVNQIFCSWFCLYLCGWCWAVQFLCLANPVPSACPEFSVDSGPTIAALQVFLSCIRSLKAFCLNESIEANLAWQNSLPTFSSLSESFRCSVYNGKKPDLDVLWIFQVLIYTCI